MRKIIFTFLFLIISFYLVGCGGYKPIFASAKIEFDIGSHEIEGNKLLGNKIFSDIKNLSKNKSGGGNPKSLDFLISVSNEKKPTSKDSAGKVLEYKIAIKTKIIVTESLTEVKILEENYNQSVTYKIQEQYSDTIKLENRAIDDLLRKVYQNLLIKLSEKIKTQ